MKNTTEFDIEKKFSVAERKQIQARMAEMLKNGEVEVNFNVGGHPIRLVRSNSSTPIVEAFKMNSSLEHNEEIVHRFNKRKK